MFSRLPRRGKGIGLQRSPSINYVLLVELNPVSAKYPQEFRLEVVLLVMLGLTGDVLLHGFLLRLADGEYRVSFLPREGAENRELVVKPLG